MYKSAKFLVGLLREPHGVINKTSSIVVENKQYTIKHYRKNIDKKLHTIVIIGGFSVYGYKDERINDLAQSIASVGYRVLIVSIPDIETLTISTTLVEETRALFNYICNDTYYALDRRISILAPSFSAGLVLAACAHESLQNHIASICCIGTYAHIENVFEYVLGKEDADDYGRNILLKNFIPYHPKWKNNSDLKNIVKEAIYDNGLKRKIPFLPKFVMSADTSTKCFWNQWKSDKSFRLDFIKNLIQENVEIQQWMHVFDVTKTIHLVNAPVVFIHGTYDNVIPPSESKHLHQLRIEKQLPSHLCITEMISHGDRVSKMYNTSEYFKIIRAFNIFFRNAKSIHP